MIDFRYGLRRLLSSPGFTAVALLTLALGIGATSGVFTLVDAILLRPLPYATPERLYSLEGEMRDNGEISAWPLSPLDISELRRMPIFDAVAEVSSVRSFNLSAAGEVEHISGELVGADYFRALGIPAALGRTFRADEVAAPGAAAVAVLSHDLWARRFGSDPSIVSRTIQLNDAPYLVIGVARDGFAGLTDEARVWLPIGRARDIYGEHYTDMRQFRWISALVRTRPGVTEAQAQSALESFAAGLTQQYPADNKNLLFKATSLTQSFTGDVRRPLLILLFAAAFVLLIACGNIANLLLVRAAARRTELAIREALGATQRHIVKQMSAEALLLTAAGAVLGLGVAAFATRALIATGGFAVQSFIDVQLNWTIIATTAAIALLCTLAFGVLPALLTPRAGLIGALRENSRWGTASAARKRLQSILIIVETALAVALLVGAGLMIKSFRALISEDLGMRTERVVTARLDLTSDRFRTNEPVWQLATALLDRARAVQSIESVALTGPGMPTGGWYAAHMRAADAQPDAPLQITHRHHVTPGYFSTLGIRLLAGRDFDSSDTPTSPRTVIISEKLAQKLWPGQNALGRRIVSNGPNAPALTVVGVVADVRQEGYRQEERSEPDLYVAFSQSPPRSPAMVTLLARARGDASLIATALQSAMRDVDPGVPLFDIQTLDDRLSLQTARMRFLMRLMSVFAALAFLLAAVGVYGITAFTTTQRRREIGLRIALGARGAPVLWLVMKQALLPIALGIACGIAASASLSRLLVSMLNGVEPVDPAILVGAAIAFVCAGLLAAAIPAVRATRVDPVVALAADSR